MHENEISGIVIDTAIKIHTALGPGLMESVYEEIIHYELLAIGLRMERQRVIPVTWKSITMPLGFKADLIVENKVIVELKSVENLNPVHAKQLLTYLKLTQLKLGLLINFNKRLLKDGITRIVHKL
jgi:GxxExxY protein